jgi:hypothetical protein
MPDEIVEDWHGKVTNNPFTPPPPKPAIRDARIQLLGAINRLRYNSTGIPTPPDLIDGSEHDFLDAITEWVTRFGAVLISVSDATADMAEELDTLRRQQQAVRDFLGLSPPERSL